MPRTRKPQRLTVKATARELQVLNAWVKYNRDVKFTASSFSGTIPVMDEYFLDVMMGIQNGCMKETKMPVKDTRALIKIWRKMDLTKFPHPGSAWMRVADEFIEKYGWLEELDRKEAKLIH